ncbi:3-phosphoshikimate 1-carboxyvinyltransferase [Bdellovibrio sp. HCB2-146]|uniref:3-phosphoshikimate 1-carboxyvinyltransferase n=1 Tax=Bdellovibrio sp. HCB2-146 TaxID=3394362 RepID=UPI0039BCD7EA
MTKLSFDGVIPGSKSVFNRILIVKSYFPVLEIKGYSECDDVRYMREGLKEIKSRSHIDCGEGGTTLRFMALRASRTKGVHTLKGTSRLMQRPQTGLLDLLRQLGVQCQMKGNELYIVSDGWKKPKQPLRLQLSESSQYASALLLNSWMLDFDLDFELVGEKLSESYFALTHKMVKQLGMRVQQKGSTYHVPAGERISHLEYEVESDLSSTFTMATAGALSGQALIREFPLQSEQPDKAFLDIFKRMHVEHELHDRTLQVKESTFLKAADSNLAMSPDLFPVLAVLCSYAHGTSRLHGAPHLVSKESNRIAKVSELLTLVGVRHENLDDGMIVHGDPHLPVKTGLIFNPDQDHRMVMAATLLKLKGHGIRIEHPEAINKSFPEFWSMIGVKP